MRRDRHRRRGVAAALADGFGSIIAAQILLGAGAGLFFPAGLQAVAIFAGPTRRGFAMGIYGVAFSGGLTVAALFGAARCVRRVACPVLDAPPGSPRPRSS